MRIDGSLNQDWQTGRGEGLRAVACLLCVLACVLFWGSAAAGQGVDTAYVNGHVLTMDVGDRVAQAVAVDGERIKAVGRNADIRALIGPNTRVVDLAGRSLLPGFIDAHGHFPESGIQLLYQVDLSSPPVGTVRSIADMLERLREKAARTPKGEWIQGVGYRRYTRRRETPPNQARA